MKTIEFDPAQIESYAQDPHNAKQTIIRMKSGDTFACWWQDSVWRSGWQRRNSGSAIFRCGNSPNDVLDVRALPGDPSTIRPHPARH
jgi:hypothetical protein